MKPISSQISSADPATSKLCASRHEQALRAGAESLNLTLSNKQCAQLLAYITLISKWNAVYNLTAIRDPAQMVSNHLLDCLAVVHAFRGARRVLDVGAGAGLPGIVLAIWAQEAEPALQVSLVDTVHKKTAFLQHVKTELNLDNVTVLTARVEQLRMEAPFDLITSRAFAELKDFVTWSQHLLASNGRFLAMKGAISKEEVMRLPAPWVISEICQLTVPNLDAQRHLIYLKRQLESAIQTDVKDNSFETARTPPVELQCGVHAATCASRSVT